MAIVATLLVPATAVRAPATELPGYDGPLHQFILSPEGNHLWAYDARDGAPQLLIRGRNADDPGVAEPGRPRDRRDINGQICVSPDGGHFISGEDTVIVPDGGGDGPGSHAAEIAGWGWFRIGGAEIGDLEARQIGKLAPESGPVPPSGAGYAGDPDNYGCGFLDEDRLLTTAIGDTLPGQPANGQLFLWFGPFDRGFRRATSPEGARYFAGSVAHCEITGGLATAGGIAVDDGVVYVATNRPDDDGSSGGVWRFSGRWPTSVDQCTKRYLRRHIEREQIIPGLAAGPVPEPRSPTPSSVVISPDDTLYVSSVFSGTVSEYTTDGEWIRDVYPASPVAPRTGPTGDTPFGLAVTDDGSLWVADLGIVVSAPQGGLGSVVRLPADENGVAQPPAETIADDLTFPDGLGVYSTPFAAQPVPRASSQWGCGDWGMLGRTLSRQFSSDCPTPISPSSVVGLRPAWYFRPGPKPDDTSVLDQTTFTTSPTVVDGVVYIGGWDGTMYALDADTGDVLWSTQVLAAPGATYGPIVSSAAVADLYLGGPRRRLVVFGAGPRLYALDARDGSEVWHRYVGNLPDDPLDPAEVESSPAIWNDTVYVGMDVHNQGGDETGGAAGGILAVDVYSGKLRWKYEVEADGGHAPSGCGGVWGSPIIDARAGRLYFGTANCPAVDDDPTLPMEQISALDARTGAHVWTFRPHDPAGGDLDEDFGATPNLFRDANGRKVLGAGSKDGSYYALDPATGKLLWNTSVVTPAPGVGGFIGATAAWDGQVFGATAIGTPPYYHSFDAATGDVRWQGVAGPSYGASAVTNGVAFAGALDSTLKAFDTETGRVLWAAPLSGPASSAPTIVGDMVFIGAGTSTSDACAKGRPGSELCFLAFDFALGQQGGVHAFRLDPLTETPSA